MRRTRSTRRSTSRRYSTHRRRPLKNRRRFKLRRLLWPFVMLLVLVGLAYGCYKLLTTPKLNVSNVKVIGTRLVDAGSVELDAGSVVMEKNILLISRSRITDRVMKKRPEIKKVGVGRILPRTVVVRVEERKPYAAVTLLETPEQSAQARSYLFIDSEGVPFHKLNKLPQAMPIIELSKEQYSKLIPGKKVINPQLSSAMECISDCRKAKCVAGKISVDPTGNLCLNIGSDFFVKLGPPVEIPKKLEKLQKMLPALRERGENLFYIDVSCYDKPVWKRKTNVPDGEQD